MIIIRCHIVECRAIIGDNVEVTSLLDYIKANNDKIFQPLTTLISFGNVRELLRFQASKSVP